MATENPNAFKNFINEAVVRKIATHISVAYPAFDKKKFLQCSKELAQLELKARVLLITKHLKHFLPESYPQALKYLLEAMEEGDLKGFELWPFSEYISQFGLEHFDESMHGMYKLTKRFTSEFAIRPYFLKDHKRVLKYFSKWATDEDVHIRRWVSEGSRPLLPWGQKLPLFIAEPSHTLELLNKLKFDDELYVRKSVANHLNDISKHHPDVVVKTLKDWQKSAGDEDIDKILWVTRHALRTLIKKGNPLALELMGVKGKAAVICTDIKLNQKAFKPNDILKFSFQLKSTSKKPQKVIVDYAIDFQKANGNKGKKVFKLKTFTLLNGEEVTLEKRHSLKPITTMKYYPGLHHLYIQVNGKIMKDIAWKFIT